MKRLIVLATITALNAHAFSSKLPTPSQADAGTAYNTGHSEVAYGTYKVKGKEYLVVYDPLTGKQKYMDSTYVTGNLAWHQLVSVK